MKYNLLNELKDVEVNEEQLNEIKDLLGIERAWKPKDGCKYWTITYYYGRWSVNKHTWVNDAHDKRMFKNNVAFQFEEDALEEAEKRNFLQQMKLDFENNSEKIDWEDDNQIKHYMVWLPARKKININSWTTADYGTFKTTNKEWLEQYIKDNEENIKKYYFDL